MEYQKSQVRPKSDYEDLEEDIWDEHIGNSQDQSHSKDHMKFNLTTFLYRYQSQNFFNFSDVFPLLSGYKQ